MDRTICKLHSRCYAAAVAMRRISDENYDPINYPISERITLTINIFSLDGNVILITTDKKHHLYNILKKGY